MKSTDASCTSLATTLKLPASEFCADIDDAVYKVLLSVEAKLDSFVTKNLCTVLGLCPDVRERYKPNLQAKNKLDVHLCIYSGKKGNRFFFFKSRKLTRVFDRCC